MKGWVQKWLVLICLVPGFLLLHGQVPVFQEGYVITKYNDTLRGVIANTSPTEITFKDSQKHRKIFYPPDLKEYFRCNMLYVSTLIPGDTAMIFLVHLLEGPIDLYGTIQPQGSNAAGMGFFFGGLIGGFIAAAAEAPAGSAGAGKYESECAKEYYGIGAFYLKKGDNEILRKVPNGRKKFNEFMIPMMRDHLEVVREIPETMFITGNLISIVRQYNAAAGK